MITPNKSLGQHWLYDEASLLAMCDAVNLSKDDMVLEIGPGLGTLTRQLAKKAGKVTAVEFDEELAAKLAPQFPGDRVTILHGDILTFNLLTVPKNYKVVANVPYYITSKIVELLLTSDNPPATTTLLVQKEVAQRMAAKPGDMSILSVAVQYYATAHLGMVVPAELFTPPPKVDSQIITLVRRHEPLYPDIDTTQFFKIVKAGFVERRKKLRSTLSGALRLDKKIIDDVLKDANIPDDVRAQALSLDQWAALARRLNVTLKE